MEQMLLDNLHEYSQEVKNVKKLKAAIEYGENGQIGNNFSEEEIKKFISEFKKRIEFIYNGISDLNMFTLEEHIENEYEDKSKRLSMSKLIISNKIHENIKRNLENTSGLSELFKELNDIDYPVGSVLMSAVYLVSENQKGFNSLYNIALKYNPDLKERTLESCKKAKSDYSDPESIFLKLISEYEKNKNKSRLKIK